MKTDQKVVVVLFLVSILLGVAAAYFIPRFINTTNPFLNQAGIARYVSPQSNPSDAAEEYHLWLKLEISPSDFDAIFRSNQDSALKDAPAVKKDEMVGDRLASQTMIQDMLVIRGYGAEGPAADTGMPLSIDKVIILAKENIRTLENQEPLADPQKVPRQKFQTQTDIYQSDESGKTILYIHLESGIKPRNASRLLSLTLVYLKDNKAIISKTLPPFSH